MPIRLQMIPQFLWETCIFIFAFCLVFLRADYLGISYPRHVLVNTFSFLMKFNLIREREREKEVAFDPYGICVVHSLVVDITPTSRDLSRV